VKRQSRGTASSADRSELRSEFPLVTYSAGNFGKNLLLAGIDVTLLFVLTDLIGITPASASALMLVVLLGDLVFDIGAGWFSTWARQFGVGYRKIIALGAVPCCLAFALLYSLPALGVREFSLLAIMLLSFRAAYAIIDVPHNSLLTRVAPDSHSRGRTSGYRLFFSSLASLTIALVLTPAVVGAARQGLTVNLAVLGIVGASLSCLALWIAAWSQKRDLANEAVRTSVSRYALFPKLDRLFMSVAVVAFVTGFAMPMFGRMIIYLATYVYDQPSFASRLLLAVTIGQLPGVVLWTYLVRHAEKTTLLALSYALAAVGIGLFAMAGQRPDLLVAIAVLIGMAFSGVFMLPWGIIADMIDFAEFRHRERRESATFACILVIIKASGAASVGVIGWTLGRLGYVPGVEQTPHVLLAMKLMAFGVPLVGSLVAIPVLARMSVGHSAHARVLRVLRARRLDHLSIGRGVFAQPDREIQ
jgi:GPH family glycoside/pentoside/hexuronide:cation symporter